MNRSTWIGLAIAALIMLSSSCKKDGPGGVPLVPVDISININNPSYNNLAVIGGWLYLTGGSNGLIVYRNSTEGFTAMDRHCPFQPNEIRTVVVDSSAIIARDMNGCGSAFLITDGSVTDGPSALPLKTYNTTFNGTVLRIFN